MNELNTKRIAKNTLFLYFRMILTMVVGLYTSRIVLQTLGIENFGIYNAVGGFIALFSILSGSLSSSISRFLTFELGVGNQNKLNKIFSSAVSIQLLLSLIIIVVAETIGLWFLNTKMNISESKLSAANWVFHLSVLTFCINLVSVPYNAAIIAHERMAAFAYVSIFEVLCKLGIAWAILVSPIDKLIFYALLMTLVALLVRLVYGFYCKKNFKECHYHIIFDKGLLLQMFSFAGWNFFGTGAHHLMTHGVSVLVNVFFGVALNAARGISMQVDSVLIQFVNNFTVAINPQITKSYATGKMDYLYKLIFGGAKYSFFLLFFFALPIFFEIDIILSLWLKNVPEHTANFIRLSLIASLIHVLSLTMITAMLATGNIKKYQIVIGSLGMLVFPLSYIAFRAGLAVETTYVVTIVIFIVNLVCRLFFLKNMIGLSIVKFFRYVLLKIISVTLISCIPLCSICFFLEDSLNRFLIVVISGMFFSVISILYVGLDKDERSFVFDKLKKIVSDIVKK
ncbi:lipopolysaccharide biosynthesis protein [Candidatus Saccharibacteria bacterium]|nr:lipopolysaccharide biosynthesis protein [Candidatus Saccharibacteria bacterium]